MKLFTMEDLVENPISVWKDGMTLSPEEILGIWFMFFMGPPPRLIRFLLIIKPESELVFGGKEDHTDMANQYLLDRNLKKITVHGGGYITLLPEHVIDKEIKEGYARMHRPWILYFEKPSVAFGYPDLDLMLPLIKDRIPRNWFLYVGHPNLQNTWRGNPSKPQIIRR